jgi:flavin reductase (DIM6/NTAB) family NADH-FMN oxidoreductase RutF
MVKECPISIECRVTDTVMLGSHEMFLADILCVHVDEACIDKNGRLDIARANLMAFAHGEYFALGKFLGKFGFSAVKKKKHPKKTKENK